MKFKYEVHRTTLLSHSSILRFLCCNIALSFFFFNLNFLKKPKGHPARSLSAVWHLGLHEGLRIALPQLDAYFWWLKVWWEPSGKPHTCPLGACRCYSGGRKLSCLLSPFPTGAPLPTALLTPPGLAWGAPKMLESAGGVQPAAEESMAWVSATETLSKTRLQAILNYLISEPDFDS